MSPFLWLGLGALLSAAYHGRWTISLAPWLALVALLTVPESVIAPLMHVQGRCVRRSGLSAAEPNGLPWYIEAGGVQ